MFVTFVQCDQMLGFKVAQYPPKVTKKKQHQFLLIKWCFQNSQIAPNMWVTFSRKLVIKNFKKSPNLATLHLSIYSAVSTAGIKHLFRVRWSCRSPWQTRSNDVCLHLAVHRLGPSLRSLLVHGPRLVLPSLLSGVALFLDAHCRHVWLHVNHLVVCFAIQFGENALPFGGRDLLRRPVVQVNVTIDSS